MIAIQSHQWFLAHQLIFICIKAAGRVINALNGFCHRKASKLNWIYQGWMILLPFRDWWTKSFTGCIHRRLCTSWFVWLWRWKLNTSICRSNYGNILLVLPLPVVEQTNTSKGSAWVPAELWKLSLKQRNLKQDTTIGVRIYQKSAVIAVIDSWTRSFGASSARSGVNAKLLQQLLADTHGIVWMNGWIHLPWYLARYRYAGYHNYTYPCMFPWNEPLQMIYLSRRVIWSEDPSSDETKQCSY